ncbi:MAG: restriction endonuclease subunit S [Thermodesulfobacteriota bacterium]
MVGKTAIFTGENAIYAGYLVRFHMADEINAYFANCIMNSAYHRKWCDTVKADALGQSNINATKLRSYVFPLAPIKEQNAIVERVDKLMAVIDELKKQVSECKNQAEMLMQSVLREAFEN